MIPVIIISLFHAKTINSLAEHTELAEKKLKKIFRLTQRRKEKKIRNPNIETRNKFKKLVYCYFIVN